MDQVAAVLFGKTRRALLGEIFLQFPRGFRLRELERLTHISVGAIQHELKQLMAADLVRREEEHGQIFYRANPRSQIFAELRSIVEKTSGLPVLIKEALHGFGAAVERAMLFGSMARGTNDADSDVDLLVVGDVPYGELLVALQPVEARSGREINARLVSPAEYRKQVHENDRFLMGILNKPVTHIIGGDGDAG